MNGTVTRTIAFDDATPPELAILFANLTSDGQAAFFHELAEITRKWGGMGWCGQCSFIAEDLTPSARQVIETLAGHALAEQSP